MKHPPDPDSDIDQRELERLDPPRWMVDMLQYNPDYVGWEPGADGMSSPTRNNPYWGDTIEELWEGHHWTFDDLNVLVHYYFRIHRDEQPCTRCDDQGYVDEASEIAQTFYHWNPDASEGWLFDITEEEFAALEEEGRVDRDGAPNSVEEWNQGDYQGHDAIDRHILIRARCERLGIDPITCPDCDGHTYIYEGDCELQLLVWVLHPRKGVARCVIFTGLGADDVQDALAFLEGGRQVAQESVFSNLPTARPQEVA